MKTSDSDRNRWLDSAIPAWIACVAGMLNGCQTVRQNPFAQAESVIPDQTSVRLVELDSESELSAPVEFAEETQPKRDSADLERLVAAESDDDEEVLLATAVDPDDSANNQADLTEIVPAAPLDDDSASDLPIDPELDSGLLPPALADGTDLAGNPNGLTLDEVIRSVYSTFPLLQASLTQRQQAAGQQLSTWGSFDKNIDASTENKGVGFYENYRHKLRLSQYRYEHGGSWYGQWQSGRGEFEPWYKEREKNEGGELSFGLVQPLKRGLDIDQRRAAIWRATYERQRVEPAIQADLISFVLDGSMTYWSWVAAGERLELALSLLDIAEERNRYLDIRVEKGDIGPPVARENERLVLTRKAAVLNAEREIEQSAAKLSLFYRDMTGTPLIIDKSMLPSADDDVEEAPSPLADLPVALGSRPEIQELNARLRQLNVSLAEARNDTLPQLDTYAIAAQDLGGAASSPDDKGEFEFEAGFMFQVPLERRDARGRIVQTSAQMAQINAQTRMVEDQILVDLQTAAAAIRAAIGRIEAEIASIDIARELVKIEYIKFDLGETSLLEVTLRELQLAQSVEALIAARLELRIAQAMYRAALGIDRLPEQAF